METPIKCPHCGYEWVTKSLNLNVSCPSCLKKVKRAENTIRSGSVGKDE